MTTVQSTIIKDLNLCIYDITNFFDNSTEKTDVLAMLKQCVTLLSNSEQKTGLNL